MLRRLINTATQVLNFRERAIFNDFKSKTKAVCSPDAGTGSLWKFPWKCQREQTLPSFQPAAEEKSLMKHNQPTAAEGNGSQHSHSRGRSSRQTFDRLSTSFRCHDNYSTKNTLKLQLGRLTTTYANQVCWMVRNLQKLGSIQIIIGHALEFNKKRLIPHSTVSKAQSVSQIVREAKKGQGTSRRFDDG